ncbi:hypothetical protein MSS4_03386 [Mycobacterium marinum]|nr:hypothetical protein MSS4_03386 [Mycobacterium marinum]
MAELGEALSAVMSRLSGDEQAEGPAPPREADWFWLTRLEVRFSAKTGPRPYLRLAATDVGMTTLYPRTTLKGATPSGNHVPDQPYPRGVWHGAHGHSGRPCRLDADATVLAYAPQVVGSYVLRRLARDCVEKDVNWLKAFSSALEELANGKSDCRGCDGN